MALSSIPAYSEFRCGDLGFAYNEAAFRHFLALERRRAHRANRSLLLILVKTRVRAGKRHPFVVRNAAQVFQALGSCVREVDVVGWFREGIVAAALVTLNGGANADLAARLAARIDRMLKAEMGQAQVAQLRVRIVRLGGKVRH